MAVDYTYQTQEKIGTDISITGITNIQNLLYVPHPTDDSKSQIAFRDGNSLVLIQKNGNTFSNSSLLVDTTFASTEISISYCINLSDRSKDQIAFINGLDIEFISRDGNDIFSNNSTKTTTSLVLDPFLLEFCPNTGDHNKDQVGVLQKGFVSELFFIQRNSLTGFFDSSSSVSPGLSCNGNNGRALYFIKGVTVNTDQVAASCASVGAFSHFRRNPSSGVFDASSATGTISGYFEAAKFQLLPNPDNPSLDLLGHSGVNRTSIRILDRDGSDLFSSSSTIISNDDFGVVVDSVTADIHDSVRSRDSIIISSQEGQGLYIFRRTNGNNFQLDYQIILDNTSNSFTVLDTIVSDGPSNVDKQWLVSSRQELYLKTISPNVLEVVPTADPNVFSDEPLSDTGIKVNALDNGILIDQSQAFFIVDLYFDTARLIKGFTYTRTDNTTSTWEEVLEISDNGEITGDYSLTLTNTLDLSAATIATRTENITLDAASTVVLNGDTLAAINLEAFTFANGTTIDNAGAADVTVTVASNPGIVTTSSGGGAVIIVAPQVLYLREVRGVPVGAMVGLFQRSESLITDINQYSLAAGNNAGNNTLVLSSAIQDDTPDTGFVRIPTGVASEDRLEYASWANDTFTLVGALPSSYAAGNGAYVGYLDILGATSTVVSTNLLSPATRDCVLRVRLGSGSSKIIEVNLDVQLTAQDFSQTIASVPDSFNNF